MPAATADARPRSAAVHRFEVRPRPEAGDPRADRLLRDAASLGLRVDPASTRTAKVYLVEAELDDGQLAGLAERLLADPVAEEHRLGASPVPPGAALVEVHPLPGVTDPAAQSIAQAIRDLFGVEAAVSTGVRYEIGGLDHAAARSLATRVLANPVVHAVHESPYHPEHLPRGREAEFRLRHVEITTLSDEQLARLSREAHLFLDLNEMRAVQAEFRRLGREPTDCELETLAQTWSEHCVHKTLKSTVRYRPAPGSPDGIAWEGRPGHEVHADGSVTIHNLLKSTVAAATHELIADGLDWTLSVFTDNSGVIAFDDETAVCIKVETHNRPSAIEPYGGAATGIGGCIRDVIGTGLGAKPIASTDVFCVAYPDHWSSRAGAAPEADGAPATPAGSVAGVLPDAIPLPEGVLHPRRILTDVVAGVRDYGNRMGIPTVNGAVYFDDRHVGNPLVFCGCVGVLPRDRVRGAARPGDLIVALGGRTGRDGIHGATFSSAELTDTHADEFSHAVQIGNAIEEKRVLDAILRARDFSDGTPGTGAPLFTAITDCGAGGFSSAVGEMGEKVGARVHLERAPLKYAGLSYTEIWISEAQERMVLAVPKENLPALQRICDEEHVELAVLGEFGNTTPDGDPLLTLSYRGAVVGELPMPFLHDGIPTPVREATWPPARAASPVRAGRPDAAAASPSPADALLRLLAHPNIASKHWIIRQYDHEVQGNTIVKPLVGPGGRGPSDAAVVAPNPRSRRALAIASGLQTGLGDPEIGGDPYQMVLAAVDECVRNLVCVGADPERVAILDNFCFPSCAVPENLGALVRTAEGCYDAAKAYRTPFISGKDSLSNQFTTKDGRTIQIPPTLLITGIGIVPDADLATTSDAKRPGSRLVVVGPPSAGMRGSHYDLLFGLPESAGGSGVSTPELPRTDLTLGPRTARAVHRLIREGIVRSAHDVSDGGLLCAVAEMLIAGSTPGQPLGASVGPLGGGVPELAHLFGEGPSRYVLEVDDAQLDRLGEILREEGGVPWSVFGVLTDTGRLELAQGAGGAGGSVDVEDLAAAWLGTLDW